ncbi:CD225/dispanin family protein [Streptomyces sclerotialus]|uniref:CD225/dispanin family protein n=1 Tax=Streptomyces sclerotialus TaxID=1957 RepID=UPI00099C14D5
MTNPPHGPTPGDDWDTGSPWGRTPPGPPPQQQPYSYSYQAHQYPQPGAGPPVAPIRTYMVPAILVTLLCFLPTGIAAIVFATQVTAKSNAGDYRGAQEASRKAKLWCVVSLVAGIIVGLIYLVILAGASGSSTGY